MEKKKVLLSVRDLEVKFRVRGRTLTAIRGVSLDIYEGESIAIVGESGSGKSVLTKTFAGMLDENGTVSRGDIIFYDEELADTSVRLTRAVRRRLRFLEERLNTYARRAQAAAGDDGELPEEIRERNALIAKEIWLSVGRMNVRRRWRLVLGLLRAFRLAIREGADLADEGVRNAVFDRVTFRVRYVGEDGERLRGVCVLNLAKIRYDGDWGQIRGSRIATVFQDPMTSLNPILTIGAQMTAVILRHQKCSEGEARRRAMEMMRKVGIPHPEKRFDDYPFQYSGGMRQRIVIAIALSCRPKILICDEPTTALDVTIQAQILELLKALQRELGYTIVFITHDLGVVANIADRVAVLYAGQIVEIGEAEEVFYDPRHPYTWALLASLPQLAEKNTELYSVRGTPPSLYNEITGDPFAPRNPYCLRIDTLQEPPLFAVSETHAARTWLLDPRAPAVEKPEAIRDLHEKLRRAFYGEGE